MQLLKLNSTNSNYVTYIKFFKAIIQVEQFKFKYKVPSGTYNYNLKKTVKMLHKQFPL